MGLWLVQVASLFPFDEFYFSTPSMVKKAQGMEISSRITFSSNSLTFTSLQINIFMIDRAELMN